MALQKQPVNINFAQGLDTKSDPWQIPIGKFFNLVNSVFTKAGLLAKRNGFGSFPAPTNTSTFLTTFNNSLLAIGNFLQPLVDFTATSAWAPIVQPRPNVQLSTLSLNRSPASNTVCDSVTTSSGLTCVVFNNIFVDNSNTEILNFLTASVVDSATGQTVLASIGLVSAPVGNMETLKTSAKVFILGAYFVILYTKSGGGEIDFTTINQTTFAVVNHGRLVNTGTTSNFSVFDGIVYNNVLYVAYQDTSNGTSLVTLSSSLVIGTPVQLDAAHAAANISVTSDSTNGNIWVSYVDTAAGHIWSTAVTTPALIQIVTPTDVFTPDNVGASAFNASITSLATGGTNTIYVTFPELYANTSLPYSNIKYNTITNASVVGTESVLVYSLGLASKAFFIGSTQYVLGLYQSTNDQSTLFLLKNNFTTVESFTHNVVASLGADHAFNGYAYNIPSATVLGTNVYISYLDVDLGQPEASFGGAQVFTYGVNQVKFSFGNLIDSSIELSSNLALTGGFLWTYDGYTPVENGFFLFPEIVHITDTMGGGSLSADTYSYQVIYTWIDNQGNVVRSAPSPVATITTPATGYSITLEITTMRISWKLGIALEIYRSSVSNPVYQRVNTGFLSNDTSIVTPAPNPIITYVDTLSDGQIQGNEIIYTTGGVLEDTSAPSTSIISLWDSRLWLVNAENTSELWYSKSSVEATPIEMSNLLTYFVAEDLGSQGATEGITALGPMDDKLIVWTKNSIRYINGQGPDNTGSNGQYSQPIHVTSTAGCISHSSLALIPSGFLFQSDKGVWLLGRDLSTRYLGAPVENYTQFNTNTQLQPIIVSAVVIPDTTQVRFVLDSGLMLVYDYFYDQWNTFTGIMAASSTLYQGLHTMLDQSGNVYQETPGTYVDGVSSPVNMSLQTGWINFNGLQGYERAYYFYLLGQWLSSHTLKIDIAYDYISTITQTSIITPIQQNAAPQSPSLDSLEQWRVFLRTQKCQAFQLTITEQDTSPGQGLTISGLNMVIGRKKGYPVRRQNLSVG